MDSEQVNLRREINERVRILHSILTAASYLTAGLMVAGFFLYYLSGTTAAIWHLLFWPLLFAPLTFNYQANQMTMEAVGAYIKSKEATGGWETFYGQHKRRVQLTSFLKVLPLLLPLTMPLVLWVLGWVAPGGQQLLLSLDVALFLLVIANFRYKAF